MDREGLGVAPVTPYIAKLLGEFMGRFVGDRGFTFFEGKDPEQLAGDKQVKIWLWSQYGDPVAYGHIELPSNPRKSHVCRFGVAVDPAARGRGLGTRVVERLLQEAKTLGFSKVNATVYADNAAMLAIYLNKYGFTIEGTYRDEERWDGESRDVMSLAKVL